MSDKRSSHVIAFFILLTIAAVVGPQLVLAQAEDVPALKAKGKALAGAQKFTEALPVYEELVKLVPEDAEVQLYLAFALLGQAANTVDETLKKELRVRARNAFIAAKKAGDESLLVLGMIEGLPPDGSHSDGFSSNAEANKLMKKGEALFSSGKLDDALKAYQGALALDPFCYYAALFSGDVELHRTKYEEAEKWYQRAIKIDQFIETAYRYSATPLMKQGKQDLARDRYVEAFIVEPYNKLAIQGVSQWGQITKTRLGHPNIDIPETTTGEDGKPHTKINITLADDGSMAWIAYNTTREVWRKEKFAKTFPKETSYRHTMAEEVDALRSVVKSAKSLKPKKLNQQIALLEKMDNDGVLEAFVLMAIPDRGIVRDHASYVRTNREQLRKYVLNYVIENK
jgi:tetratricopeptide (TPR) repeat protein